MSIEVIFVDQSKLLAIVDWPQSMTMIEIQSFLSLAGYYKRFIMGFSRIETSLARLPHKNVEFKWY